MNDLFERQINHSKPLVGGFVPLKLSAEWSSSAGKAFDGSAAFRGILKASGPGSTEKVQAETASVSSLGCHEIECHQSSKGYHSSSFSL